LSKFFFAIAGLSNCHRLDLDFNVASPFYPVKRKANLESGDRIFISVFLIIKLTEEAIGTAIALESF
jgi:hypothetical protein